ncbi:MAG: hypothetical protein FWE80_05555 [Oscillospiraceae bacterium]|nr:hypothetical protein [Oscillospiraceae bacterium]
MGCTIFYKGFLKQDYTPENVFDIVEKHARDLSCNICREDRILTVSFDSGMSEDLVFDLSTKKLNGFCKWNNDAPDEDISELYKIFDMFIDIKPLFQSFGLTDDYGLFPEYITRNKPCKIVLRKLKSEAEYELAERVKSYERTPPNKLIQKIMKTAGWTTPHTFLARLIAEDYAKHMEYHSAEQFSQKGCRKALDTLSAFYEMDYSLCRDYDFPCSSFLLGVWLSCAFAYKNYGMVGTITPSPRGFLSSKSAAEAGIQSAFLNGFTCIVNTKHAEMEKFMGTFRAEQLSVSLSGMDNSLESLANALCTLFMAPGEPVKILEMLLSMMDFLGFKYVGIADK